MKILLLIALLVIGLLIIVYFIKLYESRCIHSLARKLGITCNTGYENVLDNIYKSKDVIPKYLRTKYVCIRLLDGTAMYDGFISFYEVHDGYIEILLTGNNDITSNENVYIKYGDNPYTEETAVYLTLINGTYTIEFRKGE